VGRDMSYEVGKRRFDQVFEHYSEYYDKKHFIYVQHVGSFYDTLDSTIFIKDIRLKNPNHLIIYGINEEFFEEFEKFAMTINVIVFNLPIMTKEEESKLIEYAGTMGMDKCILFDEISDVEVKNRPVFPHVKKEFDLPSDFILLEAFGDIDYEDFISQQEADVVIVGPKSGDVNSGIILNDYDYNDLKNLIVASKVFVSTGGELIKLASCDGINTPICYYGDTDLSYDVEIIKLNEIGRIKWN
jgi:hypothetical protein